MKLNIVNRVENTSENNQQWEMEADIRKAKRRALIETMFNLYRRYYSIQIKLKNFDLWDNNRISAEIEKISISIAEGEKEIKNRHRKPYIFITVGLSNEIKFSSLEKVKEEINNRMLKFSKKCDIISFDNKNEVDNKIRNIKFLYTIEQRAKVKTWNIDEKSGYVQGLHIHLLMRTPDLKRSKIIKDYCEWWSKALNTPKHMVDIQWCDDKHKENSIKYMNYKKPSGEKMEKVMIDKILHEEVFEGFLPYIDGEYG